MSVSATVSVLGVMYTTNYDTGAQYLFELARCTSAPHILHSLPWTRSTKLATLAQPEVVSEDYAKTRRSIRCRDRLPWLPTTLHASSMRL